MDVTIKLAEAFGFCWGVDRAVSMAYEARQHFPDRRIWITNEIIHNPIVNQNLRQMGIEFLQTADDGTKDIDKYWLRAMSSSCQPLVLLLKN
jgi:4-hydroxy-3-methylbut-2-enyl diphosphate reductase